MYAQAAVKGISFPQDHFKAELEKADAHPLRLSGVCRAEHSIGADAHGMWVHSVGGDAHGMWVHSVGGVWCVVCVTVCVSGACKIK